MVEPFQHSEAFTILLFCQLVLALLVLVPYYSLIETKQQNNGANKMTKLTKKSALWIFKAGSLNVGEARRQDWNYFTSTLLQSGNITEKQYFSWTNPF